MGGWLDVMETLPKATRIPVKFRKLARLVSDGEDVHCGDGKDVAKLDDIQDDIAKVEFLECTIARR